MGGATEKELRDSCFRLIGPSVLRAALSIGPNSRRADARQPRVDCLSYTPPETVVVRPRPYGSIRAFTWHGSVGGGEGPRVDEIVAPRPDVRTGRRVGPSNILLAWRRFQSPFYFRNNLRKWFFLPFLFRQPSAHVPLIVDERLRAPPPLPPEVKEDFNGQQLGIVQSPITETKPYAKPNSTRPYIAPPSRAE